MSELYDLKNQVSRLFKEKMALAQRVVTLKYERGLDQNKIDCLGTMVKAYCSVVDRLNLENQYLKSEVTRLEAALTQALKENKVH